MQRMELLLAKTPPTDVKNDVLPMIYRALESDASQIQELCLSIIPGFAGMLTFEFDVIGLPSAFLTASLLDSFLPCSAKGELVWCYNKQINH